MVPSSLPKVALLCFMLVVPIAAAAGTVAPQVDLSLGVNVSPRTFTPGGSQTVELTVYNAGPDDAGTIPGTSQTVYVVEDQFIVTDAPPPFEVHEPLGCLVDRFVSEPLPDNQIALSFVFDFDSIPAGQSRTCTYNIDYYPSTRASFSSG